jgi:mannose-6-phosphate isomerase-like protein (cupin superfamily)
VSGWPAIITDVTNEKLMSSKRNIRHSRNSVRHFDNGTRNDVISDTAGRFTKQYMASNKVWRAFCYSNFPPRRLVAVHSTGSGCGSREWRADDIHGNEDEHCIILEGALRIANGDTISDAPAGTALTVSKGVPHAWCNLTDESIRFLAMFSPGRIEGLFREVATRTSDDDIAAIAAKFGCHIVGPPLLAAEF